MGEKRKQKTDAAAGPEVMTEETREHLLEKLSLIADLNRMAISDYKALFVELQRMRTQNAKLLNVIEGQSAVIRQLITQRPPAPAEAARPRRSRAHAPKPAAPEQAAPEPEQPAAPEETAAPQPATPEPEQPAAETAPVPEQTQPETTDHSTEGGPA